MELACALRGASVRLQMHEMLTSTRWNIWIVNTIQAHVGCWWWNMFICTVRTINQPYDGWDWENLSRWRRISLSVSTCFFHLDLSSSYRISKLFFFFRFCSLLIHAEKNGDAAECTRKVSFIFMAVIYRKTYLYSFGCLNNKIIDFVLCVWRFFVPFLVHDSSESIFETTDF